MISNEEVQPKDPSNKRRAIILSPTVSQPRYHRRAAMLMEAGYNVDVYAFQRDLYNENTYPQPIKVMNLGKVKSGRYFRRIPKLLKAVVTIFKSEKKRSRPHLIYAFGLDMAVIGSLALFRSSPLVYEVGDIQNPLPHTGPVAKLFAEVEKKVLFRCKMLVVVTPSFISDYFSILLPGIEQKSLVIENKLAREIAARFPRPSQPKAASYPLKIGYIGSFKYENCILPLMDAVSQRKDKFQMHFYGDGSFVNDVRAYAKKHGNIFYHGSFKSIDDLQKIYQAIDISYVVYDNRDSNVRMALPNKLYDGPYFGVPLIASENTLYAERIRELGIGLSVDPQNVGFAEKLLDELTPELITTLSANALALDQSYMVESYDNIIPHLIRAAK